MFVEELVTSRRCTSNSSTRTSPKTTEPAEMAFGWGQPLLVSTVWQSHQSLPSNHVRRLSSEYRHTLAAICDVEHIIKEVSEPSRTKLSLEYWAKYVQQN